MERTAALLGLVLGFIGRLLLPLAPTLPLPSTIILVSFASVLITMLLLVVLIKFLRAHVALPFSINAAILWIHFNEPEGSLTTRVGIAAVLLISLLLTISAAFVAGFFVTHAMLKS